MVISTLAVVLTLVFVVQDRVVLAVEVLLSATMEEQLHPLSSATQLPMGQHRRLMLGQEILSTPPSQFPFPPILIPKESSILLQLCQ